MNALMKRKSFRKGKAVLFGRDFKTKQEKLKGEKRVTRSV